jgi:hypothetical protein
MRGGVGRGAGGWGGPPRRVVVLAGCPADIALPLGGSGAELAGRPARWLARRPYRQPSLTTALQPIQAGCPRRVAGPAPFLAPPQDRTGSRLPRSGRPGRHPSPPGTPERLTGQSGAAEGQMSQSPSTVISRSWAVECYPLAGRMRDTSGNAGVVRALPSWGLRGPSHAPSRGSDFWLGCAWPAVAPSPAGAPSGTATVW